MERLHEKLSHSTDAVDQVRARTIEYYFKFPTLRVYLFASWASTGGHSLEITRSAQYLDRRRPARVTPHLLRLIRAEQFIFICFFHSICSSSCSSCGSRPNPPSAMTWSALFLAPFQSRPMVMSHMWHTNSSAWPSASFSQPQLPHVFDVPDSITRSITTIFPACVHTYFNASVKRVIQCMKF